MGKCPVLTPCCGPRAFPCPLSNHTCGSLSLRCSLKDPAIFLNWQDCKFFVGTKKDDQIQCQLFDKIADAAKCVTFQHQETSDSDTWLCGMDQSNKGAHPTQEEQASASVSPTRKQMCCCAVQKCHLLEGPAIFWNWHNCKLILCGSKKDDNLKHRSFARITDAANYVAFQQVVNRKLEQSVQKPLTTPCGTDNTHCPHQRGHIIVIQR
jgi:hypothetical protein